MALKAGTLNDFNGSMAEAMEQALEEQWTAMGRGVLGDAGAEDRRLMFVAIAQGVVKHLKDNAGVAFDVAVSVEQTGSWVDSSGATTSGNHDHVVAVTQDNAAGNRVQSSGNGSVSINTTGELY